MTINVVKLHKELEIAGLPVVSVRAEGEPIADYSRPLTIAEGITEKDVILLHDGSGEAEAMRIGFLAESGLTQEKILLLLVDKVFSAKEPAKDVIDNLTVEPVALEVTDVLPIN